MSVYKKYHDNDVAVVRREHTLPYVCIKHVHVLWFLIIGFDVEKKACVMHLMKDGWTKSAKFVFASGNTFC